jgi:hypothetical protein
VGALNLGALSNQNFAFNQIRGQAEQSNTSIDGIQYNDMRKDQISYFKNLVKQKIFFIRLDN